MSRKTFIVAVGVAAVVAAAGLAVCLALRGRAVAEPQTVAPVTATKPSADSRQQPQPRPSVAPSGAAAEAPVADGASLSTDLPPHQRAEERRRRRELARERHRREAEMRRAARADHDAVPNEQRYRHHRRLSPALQKFKEAREEAYRRRKEERHDPAAAAARRAREAEEKLLREAEETGVPVEELKRRRAEAPTADGSENPKPEHNNLKTKHNRRNK